MAKIIAFTFSETAALRREVAMAAEEDRLTIMRDLERKIATLRARMDRLEASDPEGAFHETDHLLALEQEHLLELEAELEELKG